MVSHRQTPVRVQLRIPPHLCLPEGFENEAGLGFGVGMKVQLSGAALEPIEGEAGFVLELTGTLDGTALPPVELEVTQFSLSGRLKSPRGMGRPLQLFSSSEEPVVSISQPTAECFNSVPVNEPVRQERVRVCIPGSHREKPVISNLIAKHGLTVNILGALLGNDAHQDGWFDLELQGTDRQIRTGLAYLERDGMQLWPTSLAVAGDW